MVRMLQFSKYFFMTMAAMFLAMPAFAHGTAPAGTNFNSLAVGIGMGIAAGLCGLGQVRPAAEIVQRLGQGGVRDGHPLQEAERHRPIEPDDYDRHAWIRSLAWSTRPARTR